MDKKLLTLFISLLFIQISFGQRFPAIEKAARVAFEQKDYYTALAFYQQALRIHPERMDITERVAASAEQFGALSIAESLYSKVANSPESTRYPSILYNLANVKRSMGKYSEAKNVYNKFISNNQNNAQMDALIAKAQTAIRDSDWAINVKADSTTSYKVMQLDNSVNTPYSDFSPVKVGDTLYYSSLKFEKKRDDFPVDRLLSKVLTSVDGSQGSNAPGGLNRDEEHVAHTAFTPDGSGMFYTICDYVEGTTRINCDIYYRDRRVDGGWEKEVKLPDFINVPGHTATQPNVAKMADGRTVLFYASNRPGSLEGSLDIWYSTIESKGVCAQPVNLLEVNTKEDEATPFYHNKEHTLFFSSMGYQSMGGYDIFKTAKGPSAWKDVEHLGYPINSSYNDAYYYLSDENKAYFSSNRLGATFLDRERETCCNDIYEAIYVDLRPSVFNAISENPITGATVHVEEITATDDRDDTKYDSHEFYFPLGFEKRYRVYATKDGWTQSKVLELTTEELNDSKTFLEKLYLTPAVDLTALTFDADSKEPLNGVAIELVELSSNAKDPKMDENGNEYLYDLSYGKRYRVMANKPGWEVVKVEPDDNGKEIADLNALEFSTIDLDEPGSFTGKFYLRKLPPPLPQMVTVYFDNDRPDEDSEEPETVTNYVDSYEAYITRRTKFEDRFRNARRLSADEREAGVQAISSFFDYDVVGGYNRLLELTERMKPLLAQGRTIKLRVQGFASPRYKEKYDGGYNRNLACRRVMSLRNYFASIPELATHLDEGLILEEQCLGDKPGIQATPPQTGVMRNKLASIYSVDASQWRKVQIDLIELSELKN